MRSLKILKPEVITIKQDGFRVGKYYSPGIILSREIKSLEEVYNELMETINEEDLISCRLVGGSYYVEYVDRGEKTKSLTQKNDING